MKPIFQGSYRHLHVELDPPKVFQNILGSMSTNDARRWIASWCRDNPSKDMDDGIKALILKLEDKTLGYGSSRDVIPVPLKPHKIK